MNWADHGAGYRGVNDLVVFGGSASASLTGSICDYLQPGRFQWRREASM